MNQGPSGPVLADGPVTDLWTLSERLVPELAERAGGEAAALTPDERARHARQRSPGARRRFLGGRLLCRLALSARTGLPPGVWRFTEGVHGRPELAPGHHGLRFNVSHTDGLIACVVTEGYASGVDVERVPFDDETVRLLTTQFDEAQRAALAEAPDPAAALQEMWVLSEAYLKGLGIGLVQGLGELRFTRCPGSTGVTVADGRRPETCRRWRLDLTGHGSGHLLAVAVDDGGAGRLRRHDLAEPGDLDRPDVPPGPWHAAGRPAAPASP
ncbi:4'-phosphopantetheinyl transferase family protein [Streptomyces sp. NPDC056470]|uniref:4'-phosphopantetheinyl transferase family protein n=1 Tax=unclassified Streptomyces TaxID=2593676 RepID=UPI00368BECEC